MIISHAYCVVTLFLNTYIHLNRAYKLKSFSVLFSQVLSFSTAVLCSGLQKSHGAFLVLC